MSAATSEIYSNYKPMDSVRGMVKTCPQCKNSLMPDESKLSCKACFSSGFVAECLECNSTGQMPTFKVGITMPCIYCAGLGHIPARKPADGMGG